MLDPLSEKPLVQCDAYMTTEAIVLLKNGKLLGRSVLSELKVAPAPERGLVRLGFESDHGTLHPLVLAVVPRARAATLHTQVLASAVAIRKQAASAEPAAANPEHRPRATGRPTPKRRIAGRGETN